MNIKVLIELLPRYKRWVDSLLSLHAPRIKPTSTCAFQKIPTYLNDATFRACQFAVVERLPFPFSDLGLPTPQGMDGELGGVTYRNTYFLTPESQGVESIHFHEIVHVVQWHFLGEELFPLLYGLEAFSKEYRTNALEQMAYSLQASFDQGRDRFPLEAMVPYQLGRILPQYLTAAILGRL